MMNYEEIEDKTTRDIALLAYEKAAKAEALAVDAQGTSKNALMQQTANESRLKSIQHRVDNTEGKLDTALDGIAQINKTLNNNSSTLKGISWVVKALLGLIPIISLVFSILRYFQTAS